MSITCLEDLDGLDGGRVLVRIPGAAVARGDDPVADLHRTAISSTVDWLADRGAVVAMAADVPGDAGAGPTLASAAATLAASLGRAVEFVGGAGLEAITAAVERAGPGSVVLLENLSRAAGDRPLTDDDLESIAGSFTHFVDDAFAEAAVRHPVMNAVASRIGGGARAVGRHMQNEVDALACLMNRPDEPFVAVVGGRCLADKMLAVEGLVLKAGRLVLGGGVAAAALNAVGRSIGCPTMTDRCDEAARVLLARVAELGFELVLPVDLELELPDGSIRTASVDALPAGAMMLDIGPRSREAAARAVAGAATLFWNGTMGRPDDGRAGAGSHAVAAAIAGIDGYSVVAGGSTLRALFATPYAADVSHVSLGGAAALRFIAGAELPGLDDIERS